MDEFDLNIIYDASLEFGENWRRPITELTRERLPNIDESLLLEMSNYIEEVREDIEQLVYDNYADIIAKKISEKEVKDKILGSYPWMNNENVNHGFSQGMYYAWHG